METWTIWWQNLGALNHWFFGAAFFFSFFFLWQFMMSIIGLAGGEVSIDTHVDPSWEHNAPTDASDTLAAFKLLSIHSILAFLTLFTWGGALYMSQGVPVSRSLIYAFIWGIAALVIVSVLLYGMRRLTSSGNMQLASCVGTDGTVHLDIPANGTGEVRVLCGNATTHFKARSAGGVAIKAGTPVKVVRVAGLNTIEVETVK
ncbi:MAG: NfeD family protein [bacterium]